MKVRQKCSISCLLAVAALFFPGTAAPAEDPFTACERSFATAPDDRESAYCIYSAARRGASWDLVIERLGELSARRPDNPWLHLYLGHSLQFQGDPAAEDRFRRAVEIFEENHDAEAEVEARFDLIRFLNHYQRGEEAGKVLARASVIAESINNPGLLAGVHIRQALQLRYEGKDLQYAAYLLDLAERDVLPDGPTRLKQQLLDAKALVSYTLGRHDEYLRCNKLLLAIAEEEGDLTSIAQARYGIAIHSLTKLPSNNARREARALFEEALAAAQEAGHPQLEVRSRYILGRLIGGEEGREHLKLCLRLAADLGEIGKGRLNQCRESLAASLAEEDPAAAKELIDQTMAASRDSHDLWATAYGSEERMYFSWATLPRSEAIADSMDVLGALEALRELQGSGSGRAGLMSLLSLYYHRLAGRVLENAAGREDLELAFTVMERLRARVLLEALEAAQAASPPPSAGPLVAQLAEVLESKVRLNRRLLDPDLGQADREQAIAELDAVESDEAGLRHQIAETAPSYGALRAPALVILSQVEQSLDENEALLSYQLGFDQDFYGRFAGGAWLFVSIRGGTRVYRTPDRLALESALDVLLGMTDLDAASTALARLYHDLLAPALADLPSGIERLVIVPDGKLHRLPFALLRAAPDAEPLIARYQLSFAPSATLWRRWRGSEPPASAAPVLALADPAIAGQSEAATDEAGVRQWALAEGARLARLPYARQEGEAVVHALGGESLLLVGEKATERFLKEHDLHRYGIIHFATHAVINDEVPERSAVLLAPGADDEDGWLQAEDIVGLDLAGRVVVLASCSGAGGQVLRGEGPMSLARAFFQAQAPVVVASLWPLPDDASARLFKRFYRRLARGASVAEALAGAQREAERRGVPARAWAGLVVLGDGDLVPFPGGLPGTGLLPWGLAVLVLAALAALVLFTRRVRRG